MRGAKIAREDNALFCPGLRIAQVDLHIGGAEDVSGTLQADAAGQLRLVDEAEPGFVGQGDDALLDQLEVALDLFLVAAEAQFEGVFQDDGQ
ncbi:hypothetical protein D3C77_609050 [compost metagenome]